MKSVLIILCSILFATVVRSETQPMTLDQVLELHTKAMGGKDAIESVKSVEIELTITEPKFTVDAVYVADRNIRMRIDIYAGGNRVYTEAFDGKQAWEMGEDGKAKDASPSGTAPLRNGIFLPGKFFGLHELPALGHRLTYEGRENVDQISYHVLKLVLDSGQETFLFIHPESGLIEKTRDIKALHPDVDPTQKASETTNSDFRKINGVIRSFKSAQKDLKTGEVMQTTTIKKIKFNPKLDDSVFEKPD